MKQFKFATLSLVLLGFLVFSCEQDDEMIAPDPPINPLEPTELECTIVEDGESRTLVDLGLPVDYIVNCKAFVRGDLSIEPGVTIQFGTDAGLQIVESGSLNAMGTAQSNIVFTGEDKIPGAWAGLLFLSNDPKNNLQFCTVEYAGGDPFNSNGDQAAIIIWASARVDIANSVIQKNESYGISSIYSKAEVSITDNVITENEMPIYIDANNASNITGGDFTGNNTDVVRLFNFRIESNNTWEKLSVPYRLSSEREELWIDDAKLIIEPGVIVEFENGASLNIGETDASTLIAVGTPQEPILFTGVVKQAGAWGGINFAFTQSPENEIAFATIEYAGNEDNEGAVYLWANPVLFLHDVTIKNSKTCGVKFGTGLQNNSNFTSTNNIFTNNGGADFCEP